MNDNIFTPHFNITDAMRLGLEQIDRQRWLIDKMLLMPKYQVWIQREISIERVASTTRIEGAEMDEAAVSSLKKRTAHGKLSEDEQANVDAFRAYEFIDYLSDLPDLAIDELVVRQLNREFIHSDKPEKTPGKYRTGQNTVGPYTPPDQGDVPALTRAFSRWLKKESKISPVLKAGIAHVHLVAIHPFWDGNGRTARGLATLILQRSPFSFRNLLSLESTLWGNKDKYFTAIEATLGLSYDPEYDATPWLEFFVSILVTDAMRLEARLTDWHRTIEQVHTRLRELNINDRQADGLIFAARTGQIARPDYIEITGASGPTASRDLAKLTRDGWLEAKGRTRSRIYYYARSVLEPSEEHDQRQLGLFERGDATE